jgi:hypothetical protein
MDISAVAREVAVSARALEAEPGFPAAYVERARAAAGALTPFEPPDDDVVAAARLLQMHAGADLHVPVAAPAPRRFLLGAVKRLIDWYLNFLIPPLADTGRTAARFGLAVTERLERVEARQIAGRDALRAEVVALRAQVAALEDRLGEGGPGDPARPRPDR